MNRLAHVWLVFLICFVRLNAAQEAGSPGVSADAPGEGPVDESADDALIIDLDADEQENEQEDISVDDYLASLSTEELKKICWDRGFDVEAESSLAGSDEKTLTHDDYVEAARRCLTLEEEMNAILSEHPELAAEIEKEIQRLQEQRIRLEAEREEMLKEKEILEAQLKQAGVDLENFRAQAEKGAAVRKDPSEMNFPEVLVESLRLLFERVKQDVVFIVKITRPAWERAAKALEIGWRYSKPFVMQAYEEIRMRINQILPDKVKPETE